MKQRRNKGEGSISKLANGKYKVVITIGRGIDGRQKRKSLTVATKAEAISALKELNSTYNTPQAIQQELKGEITFQEFANVWLRQKEVTLRKTTYSNYKAILTNNLLPYLGDMSMKRINTACINELLITLDKQGLSRSTIGVVKVVLSNIMKVAVDNDVITKNPVRNTLKLAKSTRKSTLNLPSPEQIQQLLHYLKDKNYMVYVAVVLELATGLRRGELLGLKWSNVDFEKHIIHIKSQRSPMGYDMELKTPSSFRSLYVNESVLELLKTLEVNGEYLFDKTPTVFTTYMKKTFSRLGFDKHITFHDLRHYHATELIRKGVNIKVVSKRLGHTNIQTTLDLYVHYLPIMDLEASKMIGNEFII